MSGFTFSMERLRCFRAVALAGSFHGGAREARLSQSALSRSVQALEAEMGTRLMVRSRAGVRLTRQGRLVLEFAEGLLARARDLEKRLQAPDEPLAGEIRVGSFETLAVYLWPRFLREFSKKHPLLRIGLSTNGEEAHRKRLLSEELAVVIEAEPEPAEGLHSTVLYKDRFRFHVSPGFALPLGKGGISRATARGLPYIYVPHAVDRRRMTIRDHLASAGVEHELAYSLDTFSSAREFAKAGLGIAALPCRLADPEVRDGRLVPVRLEGFERPEFGEHRVCGTFLEERKSDPKIRVLLEELRRHFGESGARPGGVTRSQPAPRS